MKCTAPVVQTNIACAAATIIIVNTRPRKLGTIQEATMGAPIVKGKKASMGLRVEGALLAF